MTNEEHFLLTKTTDNSSEVWTPSSPPLCYELRLVPPVLYPSRSLRLEFKNFYVSEISVRAVFEREDRTINVLLVDNHSLMPNCHTEQGSHDRFEILIDLPESCLSLSRVQIFCYQPSQNWTRWRLDDVRLFSITLVSLCNKSGADKESEHSNDIVTLIRSLTSVLQANLTSLRRNEEFDSSIHNMTPPITGPYYNIQLLLSHQ